MERINNSSKERFHSDQTEYFYSSFPIPASLIKQRGDILRATISSNESRFGLINNTARLRSERTVSRRFNKSLLKRSRCIAGSTDQRRVIVSRCAGKRREVKSQRFSLYPDFQRRERGREGGDETRRNAIKRPRIVSSWCRKCLQIGASLASFWFSE